MEKEKWKKKKEKKKRKKKKKEVAPPPLSYLSLYLLPHKGKLLKGGIPYWTSFPCQNKKGKKLFLA